MAINCLFFPYNNSTYDTWLQNPNPNPNPTNADLVPPNKKNLKKRRETQGVCIVQGKKTYMLS